jgi:hypothetical protein
MGTAVKLICDTDALDNLDRTLHRRWAAARAAATPALILDLDTVQLRFLAERDACADAKCITQVYQTYLNPRFLVSPSGTPESKPKPRPRPRPRPTPQPLPPDWRHESCAARIGMPAAQELARQCHDVNPGWGGQCSVERSCGALRRNIQGGCDMQFRKPEFCRR